MALTSRDHRENRNLLPRDGEVTFLSNFLSPEQSDDWLRRLSQEVPWQQQSVHLFGRTVAQPRLTAWCGDEGVRYRYSGLELLANGWPEPVLEIKRQLSSHLDVSFNSVLLNLYRNHLDSMGWHADDEKELGRNPLIASVSLGAMRKFQMRHKEDRGLKLDLELTHGSLLVMRGPTQHYWQHGIPKQSKPASERINLTFRQITN